MSIFFQWFASAEWVQIVTALLHSLWQGAVVVLLLALFLRRVSDPVVRYRVSLAALVGVVLTGMLTWAVLSTSERHPSSVPVNEPQVQPQANPAEAAVLSDNSDKIIVTTKSLPTALGFHWTGWLALMWLVGAGLMMIRMAVKVAGAGRLRRSCSPLNDARIEKLLAEARQAVGLVRQVRVGVTDRLTSPAVVGVLVPMLVLPLSLLSTLTPEQIRFVLLHELAHIRRGDYLANLFQFFVESLFFFNPAIWWISHQVRREREACCDALATALSGAPADYARTLVHVAENSLQSGSAAAPAFGNQRDSSSLLERIHRLLVPGYRPSLRLTWRAMLAGLTLGSALLILSAVGTRTTVAAILSAEKPPTNSWPDPHFSRYEDINLQPRFLIVDKSQLSAVLPQLVPGNPVAIPSDEWADFQRKLEAADAVTYNRAKPLGFQVMSGGNFHVQVGGCTNNVVSFNVEQRGAISVVVGAEVHFSSTLADWSQMDFFWTPWKEAGAVRSEMKLALEGRTNVAQTAEITIPLGGGMAWEMEAGDEKFQIVLLEPSLTGKTDLADPISIHIKSPDSQNPDLQDRMNEARDQLEILAAKLGMPHEIAQSVMKLDADTLQKMFQSESLQKYLPYADKKRELDVLQRDQKVLEMKSVSAMADFNSADLSKHRSPDSDAVRMLEAEFSNQQSELNKANADFVAVVARYGIPYPVDFSKINEKNFTDYAEFFTVQLAVERQGAFYKALTKKIESLKQQTNQASTNSDFDKALAPKISRESSPDRKDIEDKLADIHLPQISLYNFSLGDVLLRLNRDSKQFDPSHIGINFVADDDITNAMIVFNPDQKDVSLKNVLIDIVGGSTTPIRYSIEDGGIVFHQEDSTNALQFRWFMVNPDVLAQKFNIEPETNATSRAAAMYSALRKSFQAAGADLKKPKTFMYNDRNGSILIRATASDLDAIEDVIQQLNYSPPYVNIKTTFIDASDEALWGLMKKYNITNRLASGGFSALLESGLGKALLDKCEADESMKIISTPDVSTVVGRQAEIMIGDVMTVVEGIKPEATLFPGIQSTNFGDVYKLKVVHVGPEMNLIPYQGSEDDSVQITAFPSLTEFLGYEKPTESVPVYLNGTRQGMLPVPRPLYRYRTMAANVTLSPGQTLVLCGVPWKETSVSPGGIDLPNPFAITNIEKKLMSPREMVLTNTVIMADQEKILLSAEPFGKPRAKSTAPDGRQMIVLVSVRFMDPAGNSVHMPKQTSSYTPNNLSAATR